MYTVSDCRTMPCRPDGAEGYMHMAGNYYLRKRIISNDLEVDGMKRRPHTILCTLFIVSAVLLMLMPRFAASAPAERTDVGRISGVEGDVELRQGNAQGEKPRIFQPVNSGDKIFVTGPGSVKIIYYFDNHEEKIEGTASVKITARGAEFEKGAKGRLTVTRRPPQYALCGNPSRSGRDIASGAIRNQYVPNPVANLMANSAAPTFTWAPPSLEDADYYSFSLTKLDESQNEGTQIINAEPKTNSYTIPAQKPLQVGRRYHCTVIAYKVPNPGDMPTELGTNTESPYRFTVPTKEAIDYMKQEAKTVAALKKGSQEWISAALNLMITYIEFGITDRAGALASEMYGIVPKDAMYSGTEGTIETLKGLYRR